MADMATILDALTTEIREAITDITPNTMAGTDNAFDSPLALEKQNIREQSGKPRLFQVLWGLPTGLDGGHTEKTYNITGTITIGYPVNTEWNVARASDVQQIFDTLNGEDWVDGCDYRHVPRDEEPVLEEAENDWIWMIVPLRAAVTTS